MTAAVAAALYLAIVPAASATSPATVSIQAKSKLPVVTGYVWTIYKSKQDGSGTVSGKVTGAPAGSKAELYRQEFPYKSAPVLRGTQTLKSTANGLEYSFSVTPEIATHYVVKVYDPTSNVLLGTSKTVTVYLAFSNTFSPDTVKSCSRPTCHQKFTVGFVLPASALSTEMPKPLYTYLGVNLSKTGEPPRPKTIKLDKKFVVGKPKKVSSGKFERTIAFSFYVGNDGYYFVWNFCTKDTESKDGMGLPGHHNCGAATVSSDVVYLG